MGLIKNEHGVYCERRKIPAHLQAAVATVLAISKARQTWLKKSLGTKELREAKVRAKPVMMEFDRIIARAEALSAERPMRSSMSQAEIKRIADYHYATVLADDAAERREGTGSDELVQSIKGQLDEAGIAYEMPFPLSTRPEFGLSDREVAKRIVELEWLAPIYQQALARGDISKVQGFLAELLDIFSLNLDPKSESYRALGMTVLEAHVKALQAIRKRDAGEPVETPPMPTVGDAGPVSGETLRGAFEGWKKERNPSTGTLREYERAINQFTELHGDLPVARITRAHARQFREALQLVPRHRTGALLRAPLPEVVEWSEKHPTANRITAATINKQLGGVQAVVIWARDKGGFIPDEMHWADPFARMRLEEDEPDREPFEIAELNTLFQSEVFTTGSTPEGERGEAAYWLPLLALYAGGRRGELAALSVRDVLTDEATRTPLFTFTEERESGKRLKTRNSQRAVPVHPQLIKLGFLDYIESGRRARGGNAWLFPHVAPDEPGGQAAWTKWFGRYLRTIGITDAAKVFHSLRHNFVDALRVSTSDEELREALSGHGWRRTTNRDYGAKAMIRRFTVPRLAKAIKGVSYPGLVLMHSRQPDLGKRSQESE